MHKHSNYLMITSCAGNLAFINGVLLRVKFCVKGVSDIATQKTLLLIDRSRTLMELTGRILERAGYQRREDPRLYRRREINPHEGGSSISLL